MTARISAKMWIAAALVVVLVGAYLAFSGGSSNRTVTAYFSQAVSVYTGSDVDIMGVPVGRVTAVVPEGDRVRVDIEYDPQYKLPAHVKAAVVTPTLVADRFVQLAPAYDGGPVLHDGGTIPLGRTAVPVELDQIYGSLSRLTKALGPQGANRHGALSDLLGAGARALRGNGKLGNRMLKNLSGAVQTFGNNSGQLFGTVESLARVTSTLQRNDRFVGRFMDHLGTVSQQLAGERGDLRKALVALAGAIGTVRGFVHDNRGALVGDVRKLTTTLGVLARQKDTLGTVLQLAPLGLGNLTEANDPETGTVGIRLQNSAIAQGLGGTLCDALQVNAAHLPDNVVRQGCALLKVLLPFGGGSDGPSGNTGGPRLGGSAPATRLGGLFGAPGGGR